MAIAAFLASMYAISQSQTVWTSLAGATTLVGVCLSAYRVGIYEKELPFLKIEHEYEQEERRLEALRRNDEREQRAEEARKAYAEAERGRRESQILTFVAVLDSERGSKFELSTSLGPIWITHCVDDRIRVWWPDYSPVLRSGVEVVKGRAKWVPEEPKGWYLYRGVERDVLEALALL
ncbi:hypothetical protein [Sphingomonas sp. Leaf339]|uniref:hypothetical protein n=1 Tax=Sphingomonas sp. Leaf339 TaxID=1736343 RepID=UPI0012E3810F|nr:hypothetical protein [Sphingomonas sp. Leaf339]